MLSLCEYYLQGSTLLCRYLPCSVNGKPTSFYFPNRTNSPRQREWNTRNKDLCSWSTRLTKLAQQPPRLLFQAWSCLGKSTSQWLLCTICLHLHLTQTRPQQQGKTFIQSCTFEYLIAKAWNDSLPEQYSRKNNILPPRKARKGLTSYFFWGIVSFTSVLHKGTSPWHGAWRFSIMQSQSSMCHCSKQTSKL